jgi:Right handed beta helix region
VPSSEIVWLEAGTYYVANPIWVRTAFQGALRGAGKDQTIITTLPGSRIAGIPNPWLGQSYSTIFQFEIPLGQTGDLRVSDFTIVITDPEPGGIQDDNDWWQNALYNFFVVAGTKVNTRFEHLRLVASGGNFFGRNVAHSFHIGGYPTDLMKGSHFLTDVQFEKMAVSYDTFWIRDSSIKVKGNTFTNNFYGPVLEDCSNCFGEVTSNTITYPDYEGVYITQGGSSGFIPDKPSSYLVAYNTIRANGLADGVFLQDEAPDSGLAPKLYAGVAFNTITLEDTQGAGIGTGGTQKAIILSNNITGSGLAGIYAGIWGAYGEAAITDWLILYNNVDGVNATVAPVWLGSGTNHCTVIGDRHKTLVLDEGVNNILINVTKMQGSAPSSKPMRRTLPQRSPLR